MPRRTTAKEIWIGDYGIQISQEGPILHVAARFNREAKNIEPFLEHIRSAIFLWCSQHPIGNTGPTKPGYAPAFNPTAAVRLPQTPEEETELETIAAQGPAEVYKWIYGPDSLMTRAMQGMTWRHFGAEDPVVGCQRLLASIREHLRASPIESRPTPRRNTK
jgi:hypothetical protein